MAAPIACQMCTESQDAEFLVTSRSADFMLSDQVVTAVCVDCLIKLGLAMFAQQQDAEPVFVDESPTTGDMTTYQGDEAIGPASVVDHMSWPEARDAMDDADRAEADAAAKPSPKRRKPAPEPGEGEIHEEETPAHVSS
jgi:hypothetical protein